MSQISAGSTRAIVFSPPILSPDPVTSPPCPLCGRSLRFLRQTKGGQGSPVDAVLNDVLYYM